MTNNTYNREFVMAVPSFGHYRLVLTAAGVELCRQYTAFRNHDKLAEQMGVAVSTVHKMMDDAGITRRWGRMPVVTPYYITAAKMGGQLQLTDKGREFVRAHMEFLSKEELARVMFVSHNIVRRFIVECGGRVDHRLTRRNRAWQREHDKHLKAAERERDIVLQLDAERREAEDSERDEDNKQREERRAIAKAAVKMRHEKRERATQTLLDRRSTLARENAERREFVENYVIENYAELTIREIAVKIHVSPSRVAEIVSRLKLVHNRRPMQRAAKEHLTAKERKASGTSKARISNEYHEGTMLTTKGREYLKENYATTLNCLLSKVMGASVTYINLWAEDLGLTKDKKHFAALKKPIRYRLIVSKNGKRAATYELSDENKADKYKAYYGENYEYKLIPL